MSLDFRTRGVRASSMTLQFLRWLLGECDLVSFRIITIIIYKEPQDSPPRTVICIIAGNESYKPYWAGLINNQCSSMNSTFWIEGFVSQYCFDDLNFWEVCALEVPLLLLVSIWCRKRGYVNTDRKDAAIEVWIMWLRLVSLLLLLHVLSVIHDVGDGDGNASHDVGCKWGEEGERRYLRGTRLDVV